MYMRWRGTPYLLGWLLTVLIFEVPYLLLAYFVKPLPDRSNLGWFGGWVNNPFRVSDNLNRFLLVLLLVLFPGRLLSIGLADFVRVFLPKSLKFF